MIDKPIFREYSVSGTSAARYGLDGGHVGLYSPIAAKQKVFFCAVLAVGDYRRCRCLGVLFVSLDESTHFMPVIDNTGGHLHRGDHFVESINRPVSFVPELCLTPCMADNGGIGIRGGDISAVDRFG